ncbi:MAG: hypothetical protein ACT4PP_00775 [Sporichthyaceae bacterium]
MHLHLRSRHTAFVAGLSALALVLSSPAADAADTGKDKRPAMVNHEASGRLLLDGDRSQLVNLRSVTTLVDELGRAIGSPRTASLPDPTHIPKLGEYSCVYRGYYHPDFTAFPVKHLNSDYGYGRVQGAFHTYRMTQARKLSTGQRSVQYEACGVGGGDMGSKRMRKVGVGIAYPDVSTTYRIGSDWYSGETPRNYSIEMGFEVPVHKAVTIGGSITQTPTNKLMGSFEPPFNSSSMAYSHNAVNAWWQDSCVGGIPCRPWQGSKDFHGTVAQGLWEFTPEESRDFRGFQVYTYLATN